MLALRVSQLPASDMLDFLSEAFSLAGGVFLTTGLALGAIAVLYLRGRRVLAVRLAVAFAAATLVEVALKLFLPVPPLPLEYLRSGGEDLIIQLPNPYPSGHVLRSVFLAGVLVLLRPTRAAWTAAGAFVLAMAVTRIYLGVHWASDVLGGALLGLAALCWAFGGPGAHGRKEQSG